MRRPSNVTPWFSTDQLMAWVKEAPDKAAYQRRLAIWLTHAGQLPAHRVADLLVISVQSVWKWVGEYNTMGPAGLDRKGRGGRRWALMTMEEEQAFLARYLAKAQSGDVLTAKQLHPALCRELGQDVSLDYVYKLLHRHEWRKLMPRPTPLVTPVRQHGRAPTNHLVLALSPNECCSPHGPPRLDDRHARGHGEGHFDMDG